jgi:hypothetical protein
MSDPSSHDRPSEDRGAEPTPEPSGGALIGPAFGVVLGFLVLKLLPSTTSFALRALVAIAVVAVVTFVTLEITRRRAKR